MARSVVGLVVFCATFLWSVPSAAQPHPGPATRQWVSMALPGVIDEMALLAELDAFSSVTPAGDEAVASVRAWAGFNSFGSADLREELADVDDDNSAMLGLLGPAQLRALSAPARLVLGSLPDGTVDRLASGDTNFVDPGPWLQTSVDLLIRRGHPPLTRADAELELIQQALAQLDRTGEVDIAAFEDLSTAQLPAGAPAFPSAADAASTAAGDTVSTDPAVQDVMAALSDLGGNESSDGSERDTVLLIVAAAIGVATAATVLVLLRRRRRDESSSPSRGLTDLLDTSRRMTAALDAHEVQTIAVHESIRLTEAEAGAFMSVMPDGARFTVTSLPTFFREGRITSGALARVVEAGQAIHLVTSDEPSVVDLPVAIAAVPVIAAGGVTGALVVARRATEPFDANDVAALEMLAPTTGSALRAAATHHHAVSAADRDGLTNLHNRRRLDHDLAAVNDDQAVGFAMIDVDLFKGFNDRHGHSAGDEALRRVANAIAASVRESDQVYRYGGEEFSVLLRRCTQPEAAVVMERVRATVAAIDLSDIGDGSSPPITVSVGVATLDQVPAEQLVTAADAALYLAKERGRDQVVVST